ncbi:MAG: UDP-N-acetylmuramoyl-L-alanine--D-glutamate ligase [Leptolyngbyaceae cyanobacterium]
MQHASVIGLGKSGIAAARLLHQQGWSVQMSDRNQSPNLIDLQQQLGSEGITVHLGHHFDPDVTQMQRIVVSPGVPWDLPALVKARALGIETMGEMELAWRSLQASAQTVPWIGITGTNGKTTVTSLIAAIFKTAGLQAPACGNIGYAACDLVLEQDSTRSLDWVIAEVSSYQIEAASTLAPKIALWTTFTPDHLNRHKTLENYFTIKAQLLDRAECQIINGDDPYLQHSGPIQWPSAYWTSVKGKDGLVGPANQGAYIESDWVWWGDDPIVAVDALKMVGDHNRQNLLMAVAAARLAGIEKGAIAHAVATFPGVPHRLEHVCTWNGIDFINDSKATNYDAAEVGLRAVGKPVVLIAGGEAKSGDDTGWIKAIRSKVSTVLLIGDASEAFAQRLTDDGYLAFEQVETLDNAVPRAAALASEQGAKVVLLSPACASFDQYPNFEARGDDFRQTCLTYFGKG